jgi:hypothetical protein
VRRLKRMDRNQRKLEQLGLSLPPLERRPAADGGSTGVGKNPAHASAAVHERKKRRNYSSSVLEHSVATRELQLMHRDASTTRNANQTSRPTTNRPTSPNGPLELDPSSQPTKAAMGAHLGAETEPGNFTSETMALKNQKQSTTSESFEPVDGHRLEQSTKTTQKNRKRVNGDITLFKPPPGRPPIGFQWNSLRGVWVSREETK